MSKNENLQAINQRRFYLTIDGQDIPVSEAVYRAYKRPEWAERKRKEREKKCRGAGGSRCTGKCDSCLYYMDGKHGGTVSLDGLAESGYEHPAADDVADVVARLMLLEKLHEELKSLAPTDELIMQLVSEGVSEREISRILKETAKTDTSIKGLSQKSVNLHKANLFAMLREVLEDYR